MLRRRLQQQQQLATSSLRQRRGRLHQHRGPGAADTRSRLAARLPASPALNREHPQRRQARHRLRQPRNHCECKAVAEGKWCVFEVTSVCRYGRKAVVRRWDRAERVVYGEALCMIYITPQNFPTPRTPHLTPHTPHLTPHTSHLTPYTPRPTPHTPHVFRYATYHGTTEVMTI
jgi:hypothetical protein